ncbi:uncharacterized protein EV420DRAFT_1751577 [Desarmillaria tabescens]|uniref:Uncharacterized protein n=1 Tax=Armillaria tabescens TaxID=1929756 RepID=A0AA39JPZ5_ARMTA|nr:uncharacterized protein EV420DRAFT_1751577 [Desarmillaria tabescens]KAK0445691.1 hypothetical protein EV420DRAFT_1751577 [Desarmillaria tabescens]
MKNRESKRKYEKKGRSVKAHRDEVNALFDWTGFMDDDPAYPKPSKATGSWLYLREIWSVLMVWVIGRGYQFADWSPRSTLSTRAKLNAEHNSQSSILDRESNSCIWTTTGRLLPASSPHHGQSPSSQRQLPRSAHLELELGGIGELQYDDCIPSYPQPTRHPHHLCPIWITLYNTPVVGTPTLSGKSAHQHYTRPLSSSA